ncbi:MAG: hypothetical protein ACRYG7_07640 [Janthinobacterium lividum]
MQANEIAFLEEMIDTAELLDCATCSDETLHVQEEVVSVNGGVTELMMRCTKCMTCQPHLLVD